MKEKKVSIWDISLSYKYKKSKDHKYSILILHGWWWSSDSWVEVWNMLFEKWYDVIMLDLPGFWWTILEKVFTLDDYAKVVEDFIEILKLKDFILLWHSNGWAISIRLLNRWNIKPKKLILNNSAWIRQKPSLSFKRISLKYLSLPFKVFKFIPGYNALRRLFYRAIWAHDYINSEHNQFLNGTFKNMINTDLKNELLNIKIKTLIIWWENDAYTPVLDWYLMKKKIKGSKLVVLDNERHGIHLQNPKRLVETIIDNI